MVGSANPFSTFKCVVFLSSLAKKPE